MTTKLQKWGNSQGLRIPKTLLDEVGLAVGAEVEVTAEGRSITIRPRSRRRGRRPGKYTIEQICSDVPDDPEGGEVDWGPPVGKEVW